MLKRSWPIIISGCFRSGTSLVRRLLNAHPRIHCGPEVMFFRDFYNNYLHEDPLAHLRFMGSARSLVPEDELLEAMMSAYMRILKQAARNAGKKRWADKNPDNSLYLGEWLSTLGSKWQYIHVVRNPLDTLASIKEARFPLTIPEDLEGRIEMYVRYTEAGLDFSRQHPELSRVVIYEQLVAEPEQTCMNLMKWLGEEFDPAQLDFNKLEHTQGLEDPKVKKSSTVHTRSLHRWPTLLSEDEAETIWTRTSALWKEIDPNYQAVQLHSR